MASQPVRSSAAAHNEDAVPDYDDTAPLPCCWEPLNARAFKTFACKTTITVDQLTPVDRARLRTDCGLEAATVAADYFGTASNLVTCATTRPRGGMLSQLHLSGHECYYRAILNLLGAKRDEQNKQQLRRLLSRALTNVPELVKAGGYADTQDVLTSIVRVPGKPVYPSIVLATAFIFKRDVYVFNMERDRWMYFANIANKSGARSATAFYLHYTGEHIVAVIKWPADFVKQPEAPLPRDSTNGAFELDTSVDAAEADEVDDEAIFRADSKAARLPDLAVVYERVVETDGAGRYGVSMQDNVDGYLGRGCLVDVDAYKQLRADCDNARSEAYAAASGGYSNNDVRKILDVLFAALDQLFMLTAGHALRTNKLVRTTDHDNKRTRDQVEFVMQDLDVLAPLPKCPMTAKQPVAYIRFPGQLRCDMVARLKATAKQHGSMIDRAIHLARDICKHAVEPLSDLKYYTWAPKSSKIRYLALSDGAREDLFDFLQTSLNLKPDSEQHVAYIFTMRTKVEASLTSLFNEARNTCTLPKKDFAAAFNTFKAEARRRDSERDADRTDAARDAERARVNADGLQNGDANH